MQQEGSSNTADAAETYDSRAHRTLNAIAQDGQQRLADIEQQVNRLFGERDAINAVLQRIAPPTPNPLPVGGQISNYSGPLTAVRPNW